MPGSDLISSRRFGDVDAALVDTGQLHWLPEFGHGDDWITPDTVLAPDGKGIMGINWLYARTADALVLVDPCTTTPEFERRASFKRGRTIEPALEALHLDPEQVTHIVITHGHVDHVYGLVDGERGSDTSRFPNADVFFPRADWEAYVLEDQMGAGEELETFLQPARRAGRLQLVEGDVALTSRVSAIHAPGESPGHQVVRIGTSSGPIYYLGDLLHFPIEIPRYDWKPKATITDDAIESRRRIYAAAAAEKATVVFTHARFPGWGRIEQSGDTWAWRYLDP